MQYWPAAKPGTKGTVLLIPSKEKSGMNQGKPGGLGTAPGKQRVSPQKDQEDGSFGSLIVEIRDEPG
ncbi:MAG TPA: hypothetical protein GXX49_02535 [Clostridiaceae bacterium]|nr:hypothetical protein [Clostridiaceae bacterium]